MKESNLDPKIDYSFFSTENMLEPVQDAIMRGHDYYVEKSIIKELNKKGYLYVPSYNI